ncbi:btb poz domain-containing protein [Venturia nashicola]|uniref:Btb poz domain-containing protein n=1 Tax=Venturia nashicola TaxID=86259 RepID=A0A4Z1PB10_9PEZI|nr:btb poz domain-containing protein [Venturia nashicola]TLD27757.1 btb poz domain-containing protein [Venturia nashicola]
MHLQKTQYLTTFYDPQGERSQELQAQLPTTNDFSNPIPVRTPSAPDLANSTAINSTIATQTFASPAAPRRESFDAMDTRAGIKRKASDAPQSALDPSPPKRTSVGKQSEPQSARATRSTEQEQGADDSQDGDVSNPSQAGDDTPSLKRRETVDVIKERRIAEISAKLTTVLPAGKVFPIQIGSELFRLSGASISSDAPSYFSHYFADQLIQTGGRASQVKTLYIDRDPMTFRDIALHLQGYFVRPKDEEHFVKLFADAQFYSLPRLTHQLFKSEIFIQVGDRHFQIPRDIFASPGDSPNFFSLGFAHFFSTPSEVFPGLDRQTLLRPPSILPPSIPNRSGDVFADLLKILQGYDLPIRDAAHRAELLRDARYFHLKGVEQKLIPVELSFNLLRQRSEIILRLEDIRQSGVSFSADASPTNPATPAGDNLAPSISSGVPTGWITYQRPYIDDSSADLILEISASESTTLDLSTMKASFDGQTKARIASLLSVVANKLNLPATMSLGLMMLQSGGGIAKMPTSPAHSGISGEKVRVSIHHDAFITVDGGAIEWDMTDDDDADSEADDEDGDVFPSPKQKVILGMPKVKRWKEGRLIDREMEWIVRRGQWRLRVERAENDSGRVEVSLRAVRLDCFSEERERNARREFLG